MDKDVRDAATEAKKALQKAWSALYSNREVYTVLSEMDTLLKEKSDGSKAVIDAETQRLLDHTLRLFRRHGASLASHDQEKLTAMRTKISGLELDFQKNLNEDTTSILLTAAELEGCTASWISGLAKVHESGKDFYRVTMKTPDVLNVGRNAALPETRKRVAVTYRQVCTATNGPILDELIQLRHDAAVMQGYPNHAAYQLDINMAKTVETVDTFLDTITDAISLKRESDKQVLLDLKREDYQKRGWDSQFDGELYSWDIRYYMEILLKERYAVDNSLIQEYFELEHVRDQILGVYSKIFQLRFEQIPGKYWADDVTLFAVYDQKAQDDAGEAGKKSSDAFKIGYFYLDLFPRPGKYAHQCVVPLRPSYVDSKTGERILPVAVNVGNLSRPTADRPAMLKHSEANTFFHEFGHVCHAMSSRAKYSLFNFSWSVVPYPTSLAMDFLEVPSIMLENWLWEPSVLKRLGRHYKTGEELPDDLIASLVRTRKVLKGLLFSQQVAVTAIDMKLHSIDPRQRSQSIAQLWKDMSEQIIGVKAESDPSTNPACQLYHIAMGYDAGYYVYAWSEMHAHDLFTRFRGSAGQTGTRAMDETLGREYWEKVLVPNATVEPIELLRAFLGREPNAQAFQRYLTEE
ncbi:Thimet oligopeptidase [Dissophora globulifera]|uniref:Thimet oligopeptidase n=1 Tax=Dissophora globulifera TaxID=979702 RepID=A0A9P6UVM8_9FUNG|nr:Thimet oligopeptidase [Dissophora globulifera]